MYEHETPNPVDLSAEFLVMSFPDFQKRIRSLREPLTVKVDIAKKSMSFNELQELLGENHIGRFTIQATEEERKANSSLFTIAGVVWEQKL